MSVTVSFLSMFDMYKQKFMNTTEKAKYNIKSEKFQRLREIYMVGVTTCPHNTNVSKIFVTLWSSILTRFRHYIALK